MVGVVQGWLLEEFCDGVEEMPDSLSGSVVDPGALSSETDSTVPGSTTGG